MTTVTQWFNGETDPVHTGRYQRKYKDGSETDIGVEHPDYWDGADWWYGCQEDSIGSKDCTGIRLPWRGLAEKPE